MTYDDFKQQKNEIVNQTEDSAYNEFDTNCLSSSALAGAFHVVGSPNPPRVSAICWKLITANPMRRYPWPVYAYQYENGVSSLMLEQYLDCYRYISFAV